MSETVINISETENVYIYGENEAVNLVTQKTLRIGVGLDFATIKEAMASIVDATADNVYILQLYPSYKRAPNLSDTFQWKPYVTFVLACPIPHFDSWNADGYVTTKAFHGIDFSLCAAANFSPFPNVLPEFLFNVTVAPYTNVNTIADMLLQVVPVDRTILVKNTGSGNAGIYIFKGGDGTNIANWQNITTNLSSMKITGMFGFAQYFEASQLNGAILLGCILNTGTFNYANLTGAFVFGCNVTNAQFAYIKASGCSFRGSDCRTANFLNANLTNANFDLADITNAYFAGAILTGATLPQNANTKAEFKAVVGAGNWDAVTTIWTDGAPIG